MSSVFERMSNLVSATVSASVEWARGLIRRAMGLRSKLLSTSRSPTATKAMRLVSTFTAITLLALLIFVLVAPLLGFVFLTVLGDSMAPALPAGSVAIVQPVASSDIRVGDIIAYKSRSEDSPLVTHRVTEVLSQEGSVSFQTGGDRNEEPDNNPVASSSVVGKVGFHIPLLGFLLGFVAQPMGYGLLVGLPAMVIIMWEIRRIMGLIGRGRERDRQEVI